MGEGGEKVTPFEEIYKEHFGGVYRYVYSLCRNESAAEEITQETFYKGGRTNPQHPLQFTTSTY